MSFGGRARGEGELDEGPVASSACIVLKGLNASSACIERQMEGSVQCAHHCLPAAACSRRKAAPCRKLWRVKKAVSVSSGMARPRSKGIKQHEGGLFRGRGREVGARGGEGATVGECGELRPALLREVGCCLGEPGWCDSDDLKEYIRPRERHQAG